MAAANVPTPQAQAASVKNAVDDLVQLLGNCFNAVVEGMSAQDFSNESNHTTMPS